MGSLLRTLYSLLVLQQYKKLTNLLDKWCVGEVRPADTQIDYVNPALECHVERAQQPARVRLLRKRPTRAELKADYEQIKKT